MTPGISTVTTAPKRSGSAKAVLQRAISQFIASQESSAMWTNDGFRPDLELLSKVLALADPKDVRGGSVASALDMWAAATLRSAGLRNVVPRATEPFFVSALASATLPDFDGIDRELTALERGTPGQTSSTHRDQAYRRLIGALRRVRANLERGTTAVLGESRRKQVDVFVADWDRGLELLVSTKSFALAADPKEIVKNLPNRWEEFDGDLKNLRGRFPLAAIGALTIVPAAVRNGTLPAFVDMMTKLTAPGRPWVNGYDRATLLIVEPWEANTIDRVRILNGELGEGELPGELQPETFFDALLSKLLERSPITEHEAARVERARALGQNASAIARAVEATKGIVGEESPPYDQLLPESQPD